MRIKVTQADIAAGDRQMCYACPVALALRRATGYDWWVSRLRAVPYPGGFGGRAVRLPRAASAFIADFDDGWPVAPFAFDLPDPPLPPGAGGG